MYTARLSFAVCICVCIVYFVVRLRTGISIIRYSMHSLAHTTNTGTSRQRLDRRLVFTLLAIIFYLYFLIHTGDQMPILIFDGPWRPRPRNISWKRTAQDRAIKLPHFLATQDFLPFRSFAIINHTVRKASTFHLLLYIWAIPSDESFKKDTRSKFVVYGILRNIHPDVRTAAYYPTEAEQLCSRHFVFLTNFQYQATIVKCCRWSSNLLKNNKYTS